MKEGGGHVSRVRESSIIGTGGRGRRGPRVSRGPTYGYRSPLRGLIGFESSRLFVYARARAPAPRGSSSYDDVLRALSIRGDRDEYFIIRRNRPRRAGRKI